MTTASQHPAVMSPVRSMAAISLGFGLFTQVLGRVGATALAALLPGAFPQQPDPDVVVLPSDVGLVAMMVMTFANAVLAGLITGRVARFMPVLHDSGKYRPMVAERSPFSFSGTLVFNTSGQIRSDP